jgi:hypothetical protein
VTANGKPWVQFNAEEETVTVPSGAKRQVTLTVNY